MDSIARFYRRDCEDKGDCEKPTSHVLTDAVPAAVTGIVLLIAGIVIFVIARRKRRLAAADEAKERESLEIDLYEPSHSQYQGPAYGDPFSNSHSLSRDPDYNEFSLAPPTPRRDRSPANSFQTESIDEPHSSNPPPPAYSNPGSSGREVHPDSKV
ncbi:hypothetical protein PISL3812_07921 [Talaromyces islandicus]|uniref:Uncharacterized protein n=1 Tax=Talaromyces islandicus TaxID=28573 RepID=A0A0U1M5R8_TALIS|nr:hypothetical protein PISL3812_07921 [Talaromyces islandicus]